MKQTDRRSFLVRLVALVPASKVVLLDSFGHLTRPAVPATRTYICPPCGLPCDQLKFEAPGTCPQCGMTLIPADGADGPPKVAILLYNGVQLIDIAGPWEAFGTAGLLVHTVAETADPLTLVFGERVIPDYTFENSPQADVLLIPGGGYTNAIKSTRLLEWIRTAAGGVRYVMTVCTGAFIAGEAGLLAGHTATATYGMIDDLLAFPGTTVVHDQRYVESGKIITTQGLTSGIDGALYLVSKLLGLGAAQSAALNMEYAWDPQRPFVRAMLADRFLPDGLAFAKPTLRGATAKLVSTAGGTDHWETRLLVSMPSSQREIVALLRDRIATAPRNVESMNPSSRKDVPPRFRATGANGSRLQWSFFDERRRRWTGHAVVEPARDHMGQFYVTLKVALA